ncbi:MAG: peroxide stress protein YaaA [Pseudomonadota bacterium]
MLTVISPAKKLDWSPVPLDSATEPELKTEANKLAKVARELSASELRALMSISEPLAKLNAERFRAFMARPKDEVVKPAALAFDGDTYTGLQARAFDEATMGFAQDRLRILSGLYGVLRPMDRMQPYRLEMGSRLATERGRSLYDWWGDKIAKALNKQAKAVGATALLNCASQEYFGAVDRKALRLKVIEPVFLEERDGEAKTISFFAKRARGAMARFAMENRIEDPADLRGFALDGYRFRADGSDETRMIFARAHPEREAA